MKNDFNLKMKKRKKCEYQGEYCKGFIDGKIKYSGGKKVCSWCYWKMSQLNKKK